jgi:hypothetical protein
VIGVMLARLIEDGRYAPVTMNTDLGALRVIMTTAKVELGLMTNPFEGLAPFDTSQHPAYTFEDPNSLTVNGLREFLACMQRRFPKHYAMTFLGFATGKRPSTMRPLRRRGPTPDVHWESGVLLFRRSNTFGQKVMEGVKTGGEERVRVPDELLDVLRWHVDSSLSGHATEALQRHYNTVSLEEQRRGLSNVIQLLRRPPCASPSGEDGGEGQVASGQDRKGGRG